MPVAFLHVVFILYTVFTAYRFSKIIFRHFIYLPPFETIANG